MASGRSVTSSGRSSTSKMRANSAVEVAKLCPMVCIAVAGPTSRLSMLVNATTVPIVVGLAPPASMSPASQ